MANSNNIYGKYTDSEKKRHHVTIINFSKTWTRTHQYPDLLLSVSVNYHVAGAGDAYVTSESIFCKTPPILN